MHACTHAHALMRLCRFDLCTFDTEVNWLHFWKRHKSCLSCHKSIRDITELYGTHIRYKACVCKARVCHVWLDACFWCLRTYSFTDKLKVPGILSATQVAIVQR